MNYQFTSRHLTLDSLSTLNQGHMYVKSRSHDFQKVISPKLSILLNILHETHVVNHI